MQKLNQFSVHKQSMSQVVILDLSFVFLLLLWLLLFCTLILDLNIVHFMCIFAHLNLFVLLLIGYVHVFMLLMAVYVFYDALKFSHFVK